MFDEAAQRQVCHERYADSVISPTCGGKKHVSGRAVLLVSRYATGTKFCTPKGDFAGTNQCINALASRLGV